MKLNPDLTPDEEIAAMDEQICPNGMTVKESREFGIAQGKEDCKNYAIRMGVYKGKVVDV